jgi:dienelactone hydrolase
MGGVLISLAFFATIAVDPSVEAVQFLERCRDGQFATAVEPFDAKMKDVLSAPKLEATWKAVGSGVGGLKSIGTPRASDRAGRTIVLVRCEFEKAALDAHVSFDGERKIDGFFLRPAAATGSAPYVDRAKFEERDVTVGAEGWPLGATLATPGGAGPFPLVVLLHGSGPHDRDETIGPNAPFRDLGRGLASRGIATLRYDKRTQVHARRMAEAAPTLDSEVIEDALTAIRAGRSLDRIDARRVFVLGHSLGAVVGPEVARRDGKTAGLIWMAGNIRPIDEVVLDQARFLARPEARPSEQVSAFAREVEAGVATFRADPSKAGGRLLGAPYSYWKALAEVRADRDLADQPSLPVLGLQGGRDYQVTEADFGRLRESLRGRANATFHHYPELNHLFIPGTGPSGPAEYDRPGHVDARVIDEIARWIETIR